MKRRMILAAVASTLVGAGSARLAADAGQLKFKVFGDIPLVTVRGVPAAGNPWVTDNSEVRLAPNGDMDVRIRGLVIAPGLNAAGAPVPPAVVGTNPVATVRIAVTWAVPAPQGVLIQETGPLALDANGDLRARVNVGPRPAGGERPVLLVRAGAAPLTGPYIALSDFVRDFGSSHPSDD